MTTSRGVPVGSAACRSSHLKVATRNLRARASPRLQARRARLLDAGATVPIRQSTIAEATNRAGAGAHIEKSMKPTRTIFAVLWTLHRVARLGRRARSRNPRRAARRLARGGGIDQQRPVRQDAALSHREHRGDQRHAGSDAGRADVSKYFQTWFGPTGYMRSMEMKLDADNLTEL